MGLSEHAVWVLNDRYIRIVCWGHVPNECSHGKPDLQCGQCAQRRVDNVTSFDKETASGVVAARRGS